MDATDPRAVRTRTKILDAACAVVSENGVSATTMGAIAARAGISRSTLYRHWSDLDDLITASIENIAPDRPRHPGDNPLDELRQLIGGLGAGLRSGAWAQVAATLAEAAERDPALARVHGSYVRSRRAPARSAVKAAQRLGLIRHDLDADWVVTALAAPLYYRRLVLHRPMSHAEVDSHISTTLALVVGPTSAEAPPNDPLRLPL